MTEHDVTLDGVRLRCAVGPENGPPLLLLHGGSSSWRTWEPLLPGLVPDWTVYALDLRGHGGSERTPGRYGVLTMGKDAAGLLHYVVGQPTVLVGHSLGAPVALAAAESAPHLARAVVWGEAPLDPARLRMVVESQREMTDRWRHLCGGGLPVGMVEAALRALPVAPGAEQTLEQALGEDCPWFSATAENLYVHDPEFLVALLYDFEAMFAGYDPARMVAGTSCPLLLVQGDPQFGSLLRDDEVAAAEGWRAGVSHVRVPGVGHALHAQDPGPVLAALQPFLQGLLADGR